MKTNDESGEATLGFYMQAQITDPEGVGIRIQDENHKVVLDITLSRAALGDLLSNRTTKCTFTDFRRIAERNRRNERRRSH